MYYLVGGVVHSFIAHWYFCLPGAEPLPFPTVFCSANWDEKRKQVFDLGDDATQKAVWRNGSSLNSSDASTWAGPEDYFAGVLPAFPIPCPRGPDGTPLSCKGLVPMGTAGRISKFATENTVENSALNELTDRITSDKALTVPSRSGSLPGFVIEMGPVLGTPVLGGLEINLAGVLFVGGVPVYSPLNPPPAGISGSGTAGKVPLWSGSTALADSHFSDDGTNTHAGISLIVHTAGQTKTITLETTDSTTSNGFIGWNGGNSAFYFGTSSGGYNARVIAGYCYGYSTAGHGAVLNGPGLYVGLSNDCILQFSSTNNPDGTPDVALSRTGSSEIALGDGTAGDYTGNLLLGTPTNANHAATKNYVDTAVAAVPSPPAKGAFPYPGTTTSTYAPVFDLNFGVLVTGKMRVINTGGSNGLRYRLTVTDLDGTVTVDTGGVFVAAGASGGLIDLGTVLTTGASGMNKRVQLDIEDSAAGSHTTFTVYGGAIACG